MSTEHQRYSTENQSETIRRYAEARGFEIVRTYADDGKTGLNLEGRKGLRALLGDIEAGENDFSSVLVYDVSRWGRFQDADESAYYEFVCRRANDIRLPGTTATSKSTRLCASVIGRYASPSIMT